MTQKTTYIDDYPQCDWPKRTPDRFEDLGLPPPPRQGPVSRKHYGPGEHPGTGTPQDVHGRSGPRGPQSDLDPVQGMVEQIVTLATRRIERDRVGLTAAIRHSTNWIMGVTRARSGADSEEVREAARLIEEAYPEARKKIIVETGQRLVQEHGIGVYGVNGFHTKQNMIDAINQQEGSSLTGMIGNGWIGSVQEALEQGQLTEAQASELIDALEEAMESRMQAWAMVDAEQIPLFEDLPKSFSPYTQAQIQKAKVSLEEQMSIVQGIEMRRGFEFDRHAIQKWHENTDGTNLHKFIEDVNEGLTTLKVTSMVVRDQGDRVMVKMWFHHGLELGQELEFDVDDRGSVHLSAFVLNRDHQGEGNARGMLASIFPAMSSFARDISFTANGSVGGYAWARMGALPVYNDSVADYVSRVASDLLDLEAVSRESYDAVEEILNRSDREMVWEIADLRTPVRVPPNTRLSERTNRDVVPLGAALLLGSSWGAEFNMEDPPQTQRAMAYLGVEK